MALGCARDSAQETQLGHRETHGEAAWRCEEARGTGLTSTATTCSTTKDTGCPEAVLSDHLAECWASGQCTPAAHSPANTSFYNLDALGEPGGHGKIQAGSLWLKLPGPDMGCEQPQEFGCGLLCGYPAPPQRLKGHQALH